MDSSSSSSEIVPVRIELILSHYQRDDAYGVYLEYPDHVEFHFDLVKKNKWHITMMFASHADFVEALPEIEPTLRMILRCRLPSKVYRREKLELESWISSIVAYGTESSSSAAMHTSSSAVVPASSSSAAPAPVPEISSSSSSV